MTMSPGPCIPGPAVFGPLVFGGAPIGGLYAPVSYEAARRPAALQFTLHHPAVTAAVIGARSAEEITTDVSYAGMDIPGALWAELDVARRR